VQPQFRSLVVALVPQPRQVPPTPYEREELQRVFFDVNRVKTFSQFAFLPGDSGAQILNSPHDRVAVTPQLVQIHTPVELTAGRVREETIEVLSAITERLKLESFVQGAIDVTAHAAAPGELPDAQAFVRERLLRGADHATELGADFFVGGVKFRRSSPTTRDENLSIEPLVADNHYLWVNYNIQIFEPVTGLDRVAEWIDSAFDFVTGPAMSILEA
jgi:hypothetical protein